MYKVGARRKEGKEKKGKGARTILTILKYLWNPVLTWERKKEKSVKGERAESGKFKVTIKHIEIRG